MYGESLAKVSASISDLVTTETFCDIRKDKMETRSESGNRIFEKLASVFNTSRLRRSNTVRDRPPELKIR